MRITIDVIEGGAIHLYSRDRLIRFTRDCGYGEREVIELDTATAQCLADALNDLVEATESILSDE